MSDVRFAAALPQLGAEPGQVVAAAQRAEALGFSRLWTLDPAPGGPTAQAPVLDGLHLLSHAAAVTDSIALGIAVIVLPNRNPIQLSKELASIDRLSGGRLLVGVGLGRKDPAVAALGFPTERRVRRLTEAIAVMRALWRSDRATYHGELWSFDGLGSQPRPAQQGGPPIWLGAGSEPALRRAARIGDGWIGAGSSSSEDFVRQAPVVDAALREAGRDPATFPKAKRVYIAVEDDADTALARLAAVLDPMYGRAGMAEHVGLCGPPEHCAAALRELAAAGATELLLHPLYDPLEQLERLGEVARLVAS
jgi:probable F420-dependent oxidoreductase